MVPENLVKLDDRSSCSHVFPMKDDESLVWDTAHVWTNPGGISGRASQATAGNQHILLRNAFTLEVSKG